MVCKKCFYTEEHEWVRVEGSSAVVGITDHAQESLGDITFVEMPVVGKTVARSEQLATIESSKAASDIYAPVGGSVTEVNEALTDEPERINRDCFDDGWICKLQVSDPDEVKYLMTAKQYEDYLKGL